MKKVFQKIIYTIPEILIILISILLLIVGFINIRISAPPNDINKIEENINKTYCIPILKLDDFHQEKEIKIAMNKAYILVVLTIYCGFFLFLLGAFLLYNKLTHTSVIKIVNPQTNKISEQFHNIN